MKTRQPLFHNIFTHFWMKHSKIYKWKHLVESHNVQVLYKNMLFNGKWYCYRPFILSISITTNWPAPLEAWMKTHTEWGEGENVLGRKMGQACTLNSFSCFLGKSALGCAGCIFPPYTAPLTFQVDIVSTLSYFDVYNVFLFFSLSYS